MYEDDAALFARGELDLKRIVESFVEVCRRRLMGVNVNKSKVVIVKREGNTVCKTQIK